ALDLDSRLGSNLLEHLSLSADQDAFLTFPLAVDGSGNSGELFPLLELLDHNRRLVRHLLGSLKKYLFPDQLPCHEARRLVCHFVLAEVARTFRQGTR